MKNSLIDLNNPELINRIKILAQVAYEAYWNNLVGESAPRWEDCPEHVRHSYYVGIVAILGYQSYQQKKLPEIWREAEWPEPLPENYWAEEEKVGMVGNAVGRR